MVIDSAFDPLVSIQVRILDQESATRANTRVLIEFYDKVWHKLFKQNMLFKLTFLRDGLVALW